MSMGVATRTLSWQKSLLAISLAAVIAAVALIAESRGHVERMAYGDGLIYRYVASHLTTPASQIDPVVASRGSSIRYGRIGFPILIWIVAAGQPGAMPYAQAILIIIFAGLAGAATMELFPRAGPIGSVLPFLAPGFALSVVGGYGEVMAVALALWAVILVNQQRHWLAAALLAMAMLTRENAGAVLIGLVAWALLRRRAKGALVLLSSVIPLIGWYLVVKTRFGQLPLLDTYLRKTTDTIGPPIIAVWHSLSHGPSASIATASARLALALIAFWLWRKDILAIVAAAAGLQVLTSGTFAWHFIGDAMRAFTFLELFLLLTLLRYRWPEPAMDAG